MSKASEWVEKCRVARECGPSQFISERHGKDMAVGEVDYRTGNLKLIDAALTPEQALELAHWINDTFGE